MSEAKRVLTFGTFDIFHYGHARLLERAKDYGDLLIVGISTDQLNYSKKNRYPFYSQGERLHIVSCMRFVDHVFYEESLELKRDYIQQYNADVLVMGDDWKGRFDYCNDLCEVVYLERTPAISTTGIIEVVRSKNIEPALV
ncbi:adenylyltransferase/cytidyltransferase family protein [Endozoicomonas euniceicola]|uniref:Adenylyltransferase/cytidyltransferase family protein n=1 Tax=Endozoicomonas euniceicola TaxID=1234143 RepID=A0ABY6GSM8_9GAMM|nr:adenylyltransferase/cytidyltransferase family protein [Endozoicomonas euniceicola]UYM15705.1 adenylyltransferase/cytidyltransferase family protein [Endozoicomonas euniceicola]